MDKDKIGENHKAVSALYQAEIQDYDFERGTTDIDYDNEADFWSNEVNAGPVHQRVSFVNEYMEQVWENAVERVGTGEFNQREARAYFCQGLNELLMNDEPALIAYEDGAEFLHPRIVGIEYQGEVYAWFDEDSFEPGEFESEVANKSFDIANPLNEFMEHHNLDDEEEEILDSFLFGAKWTMPEYLSEKMSLENPLNPTPPEKSDLLGPGMSSHHLR